MAAGRLAAARRGSARAIEPAARAALAARGVEPEYLELVDPDTLAPLERLERPGLLALAARIGAVRLIDNATIHPAGAPRLGADGPSGTEDDRGVTIRESDSTHLIHTDASTHLIHTGAELELSTCSALCSNRDSPRERERL